MGFPLQRKRLVIVGLLQALGLQQLFDPKRILLIGVAEGQFPRTVAHAAKLRTECKIAIGRHQRPVVAITFN